MPLTSPFPFHGPLEPDQVHGRDAVIADLVSRITARRPTVLIAPRRFGKTSVLGATGAQLEEATTVVRIDLYEIRSWEDLAVRLDRGLAEVAPPRRSRLDTVAAGFELSLGIVKASFARSDRPAGDLTVDRLLDVLVEYARLHPTVVIFDEFSSIGRVDGAAGLLRTRFQHYYQQMGLVFAGSEPSVMRLLFTAPEQPFYAQADLVELGPLDKVALAAIVDDGFGGEAPPALAARIHGFTDGHPQRSMQLADAAWQCVEEGTDRDNGALVWGAAVQRCRAETAASHETRFSTLGPTEQAVMRLAAGDGALFGRAAELLALSHSSAQRARSALLDRGQIVTATDRIRVVDPLYADWIRDRFGR